MRSSYRTVFSRWALGRLSLSSPPPHPPPAQQRSQYKDKLFMLALPLLRVRCSVPKTPAVGRWNYNAGFDKAMVKVGQLGFKF